jgi:hypothetical protein
VEDRAGEGLPWAAGRTPRWRRSSWSRGYRWRTPRSEPGPADSCGGTTGRPGRRPLAWAAVGVGGRVRGRPCGWAAAGVDGGVRGRWCARAVVCAHVGRRLAGSPVAAYPRRNPRIVSARCDHRRSCRRTVGRGRLRVTLGSRVRTPTPCARSRRRSGSGSPRGPTDRRPTAASAAEDVGTDPRRGALRDGAAAPFDQIKRYVMVTKPRIVELLLVTTVPAMVVAASGWPSTWLVIATVLGGALSAGSANALNNYADRDIDRRMARTAARPTARDEVSPRGTLIFGVRARGPQGSCGCDAVRQPRRGVARDLGDPVLRVRLHARAQAPDAPGRGDRGGRRLHARPHRVGGGQRGVARRPARGCCSPSCSSGNHRTSGPSR